MPIAPSPFQKVSAEVRGGKIIIKPEGGGGPALTVPNVSGATGFLHTTRHFHKYNVPTVGPDRLANRDGLAAIGQALAANPTPGRDHPATPQGTRNDVGNLIPFDGDDNFVLSYLVRSPDPSRMTNIILNYTISGQHRMHEGFVLRYGFMVGERIVVLRSYGEGKTWKMQSFLVDFWWPEVQKAWNTNQLQVFNRASGLVTA